LAPETPFSAASAFIEQAAKAYAKLMQTAAADPETGLGGRLFYAGELDEKGRALVVAANIAGAATLVATGDRAAQKQALRDGVADFLVNSLDEALRVLKNQLRKRESVSVSVVLAPATIESEMRVRGVAPDLQRWDALIAPINDRLTADEIAKPGAAKVPAVVTWSVASSPAQWLPRLDGIALDCLDADAWAARRWVRLAPRYLGRMAQNQGLLICNQEFAARFVDKVRMHVEQGEIGVAVEVRLRCGNEHEEHRIIPGNPSVP
jgi:hypothetical protein